MDIHKFYDETFDHFLRYMKPNELEALIHDMGMRAFNNDSIKADFRTNIMWTKNGNYISSYDLYPSDLTFPEKENAERFIDTLNNLLDTHPGYIELNEFYEAYNNQIHTLDECLVPTEGIRVNKVITNPVDTVSGFLLDEDTRIDKVDPTKGITRTDLTGPIISKRYPDNQYHIDFDEPTDISKAKVAYIHSLRKREGTKK